MLKNIKYFKKSKQLFNYFLPQIYIFTSFSYVCIIFIEKIDDVDALYKFNSIDTNAISYFDIVNTILGIH